MNVLSLFDGISCGQEALRVSGIKVDNYYASEIDESAIKITHKNYPDTIQVGDVSRLDFKEFPKIDLLIGGSPCQGFSFAGKNLNFSDPRSILFFEYLRALKELSPKYFLLENVKMKKESMNVITDSLNVQPVLINSSMFSAQDRKRLYWTNIENVKNKTLKNNSGLVFLDVLEQNPSAGLFLKDIIANRFRFVENYKLNKNKSCVIGKLSKYQGDRVFDVNAKASCLSASSGNNSGGGSNIIFDPRTFRLRKISPVECERLQCLPDNYTETISDRQRYKAIGNGWNIDTIVSIFSNLKYLGGN